MHSRWTVTGGGAIGLAALLAVGRANGRALSEGRVRSVAAVHLPDAQTVRLLAPGFDQLSADYFWLAAIQYFGEPTNEREEYRALGSYLDLTTELDPRFCYAYVFGGSAMPFHRIDGRWSSTGATIHLLKRGAEQCPAEWRIHFLLGYSLFTFTDDYEGAAREIQRAAALPRAPRYLGSLAARLYSQGGDLEKALSFAIARLRSETDPFAISEMKKRIAQIELELDLRLLRAAAKAYEVRRGAPLRNLRDLVAAGLLRDIPDDPMGGSFFLDESGTVASRHEDQLLRLHVHPGGHLREEVVD